MSKSLAPKTLIEAVHYFADEDVAHAFVTNLRPDWPNGPVCPRCDSPEATFLKTRRLWKCRSCAKQFSVKVGTIFEDSPIKLSKWLPAMWMVVNMKNGISSHELARALGVTQKTAWFMLHRLRLAMQSNSFRKLSGDIEVDETYIGGKARNMHDSKRKRVFAGSHRNAFRGKVAVMGLLDRHGNNGTSQIRTAVVAGRKKGHLQPVVREHVETGATLNTDAHFSYQGLASDYMHKVIDHAEAYVDGQVHTNGCENFWSLLKRAIKGTYVSVEPFHLFRYLDEQVYRFNNRGDNDAGRFINALRSIVSKRVTYDALTGRSLELPQSC
jgi:transposase-like protein